MKTYLSIVALVLSVSAISYGTNVYTGLQDFFAPIVQDKDSSLVNLVPAGTIVYENESSSFFGLKPNGTWAQFGVTSGNPIASSASNVRAEYARAVYSSGYSVSSNEQSGAFTISSSSTGTVNFTVSPAFTYTPVCTCTVEAGYRVCSVSPGTSSITAVVYNVNPTASSGDLENQSFSIHCIGR